MTLIAYYNISRKWTVCHMLFMKHVKMGCCFDERHTGGKRLSFYFVSLPLLDYLGRLSLNLTLMRAIWEVHFSQAKAGRTSTLPLFQLDFITGSSLPSFIAGMFNQNKTNFHKLLNSDLGLFLQINWYWNNYFSESVEEKDVKRKLKSN